jgi:hypothetical protein
MHASWPVNVAFGWVLILIGFATGTGLGLFFHREDFWGGYASFRRRIVRLGHIALVALGMVNILFGLLGPDLSLWSMQAASWCFVVGGVAMPGVCFLSGWKAGFRYLFFIPVISLLLAVAFTLKGLTS